MVGPCPVCGGEDRFYVTAQGGAFCRKCCPDGGNPDAFKALLRAAFGDANGGPPAPRERKPAPPPSRTQAFAMRIIGESKPAAGTPAEEYLASRAIRPGDYRAGALRFHPAVQHKGVKFPALVAIVWDAWRMAGEVEDGGHYPGEPVACQCTFLDGAAKSKHPALEGNPKRSYGPVGQGAVYLGTMPEGLVALAEGVENAVSLGALAAQAGARCHPVATLGAGGLSKWNPPAWCSAVLIAADGDPAGMRHAQAAHRRFTRHGLTAVVRQFKDGADANDLLQWERTSGHDG